MQVDAGIGVASPSIMVGGEQLERRGGLTFVFGWHVDDFVIICFFHFTRDTHTVSHTHIRINTHIHTHT